MTDGRPDHGFSFTPRPIAAGSSSRARRRRISALVVLFVAGGLVAIASFGPRLGERPSFNPGFFATPQSSAVESPSIEPTVTTAPLSVSATPLPLMTRNDLGMISGTAAVLSDGFRVVDLGTGGVPNQVMAVAGQDTVVPSPTGSGWVCVCVVDQGDEAGTRREVDIVRIAADGTETSRAAVALFPGPNGSVPALGIQSDVDLSADGRSGVIALVVQTKSTFTTFVAPVNVATGSFGPVVKLATQGPPPRPSSAPTPPPPQPGDPPRFPTSDTYPIGPSVRMSPDGRHAFVWEMLELQGQDGPIASSASGWRVDLTGSDPRIASAPGLAQLPRYCGELVFVDDARVEAFCRHVPTGNYDPTAPAKWTFVELDMNAQIQRRSDVDDSCSLSSEVLFDVANDAVWLWSSSELQLCRVNLATLRTTRVTFDPTAQVAAGGETVGGAPPVWRRPFSASAGGYASSMAGAPRGDRLYLIGNNQMPADSSSQPASLGIFVVDPATLALVARWSPDALYVGLQAWRDGSMVVAVGAAQVDATGHEAPWDASLTFHDATDGRILLRLGQLGQSYGAHIYEP